jgi:hypothetical protein
VHVNGVALERLGGVEDDVIKKPGSSSGEHARANVLEGELERLYVVADNVLPVLDL